MNRLVLFIVFLFCNLISVKTEIKLPAIFSDNMLLQQNTEVNIWGKSEVNKTIIIKASWNKKTIKTIADNDGNWKVTIHTPKADEKTHSISFTDGKPLILNNIILGELWLCSGQSNMEMPMKGFKNQPVENSNMDILKSANPKIRIFTIKRNSTIDIQKDLSGQWQEATPESVKEFSATAYYFGRLLNQSLNVPVGLVLSAWGGSCIEAWMSEDMLRAFPQVNIPKNKSDIKEENRTPTTLYQAMINPIVGLTIKGVIWYQGETNYDRAESYADMFTVMINGWRKNWAQKDTIPFYYCQIAPFDYGIFAKEGQAVINSAYLREAQSSVELKVQKTAMAVLLDAGLKRGIHPGKKQIAGERLALLALSKSYGIKSVTGQSPCFKEITIQHDTIIVSFDQAPMWIASKTFESKLFKVAGKDKIFHPAKAWIVRSKVYVKSEKVKDPVAVRYAFENYVEGDLFSTEGLPVSSFRSDNYPQTP